MKKIILFISIFILLIISSKAQEDPPGKDSTQIFELNLQEAQQHALQYNYDIKNKKVDIEIAKKDVWATTAIGLPQFNISGSYQHTFDVPVLEQYASQYEPIPNVPDLPWAHSHSMDTFKIELGSEDNTTIDFTLSQLIFSGEYIVGLQASRVYKSLSEKSLKKTERDVKESVAQSYYTALVMDKNVEIVEKSLKNITQIESEMAQMHKAGFIKETDLDQIKLTRLTISNTFSSLTRQRDLSKRLLKLQMGIAMQHEIVLTDSLKQFLDESEFAALLMQQYDVNSNIDYQMLEVQQQLSELSLKREQSKYLPSLSAYYRHQEQINAPEFNFQPPDVIGISLEVPILSSGKRRANVQKAKLELEKSKNSKKQVEQSLLLEYEQTRSNFLSAREKFNNQKENLQLAQKIYDKTLIKYKTGSVSSLELTQIQNQYFDTQSNYFRAMADLLNAKATMDKLLQNQ